MAAKLGDPDAQQSLAFCLAHGKGCKKDRKEAAKWYRAAVCPSPHVGGFSVRILNRMSSRYPKEASVILG